MNNQKENKQNYIVKRSSAGLGLFAQKNYKKDDFIIEYKGNVIKNNKADEKGGRYLFDLDSGYTIDGSNRKNIARYINHSCKPNSEAWIIDNKHIYIYATKKITPEEEITIDYGKEYFDEFIKPYGCKCSQCSK